MRIFLAGATGVTGRRLTLLLRDAGQEVTGTTRHPAKASWLQAVGIAPVVVDVFDADAVMRAVAEAQPDVVIHQLTDLPNAPGTAGYAAGQEANRRLRIEGTRTLVRAAAIAGAGRSSPRASPSFTRKAKECGKKAILSTLRQPRPVG